LMRESMTGSIQLFISPPSIPIAYRIRMLDFGIAPRIYTSWLHWVNSWGNQYSHSNERFLHFRAIFAKSSPGLKGNMCKGPGHGRHLGKVACRPWFFRWITLSARNGLCTTGNISRSFPLQYWR
jgi:hypothetical protein